MKKAGVSEQIKKHYKNEFSSYPKSIDENEIAFIEENDCQCTSCGKSIFELDDFPKILIEDKELLCEDCYDERYREDCPICEEYYDTKDYTSDYIVINEELSKETRMTSGIYKILERPFFFGSILSGFDAFFDNTLELVVDIKINEHKKIDCGDNCQEVNSGCICPDCEQSFVHEKMLIKTEGKPCILFNKHNDFFKDYTQECLRKSRQHLINNRITLRGMIEKGRIKLDLNDH
ncbi:hypothetical protein [Pedobacter arcticus]|uniref:hypothetical protein n=1 Tax=Pedobacter arcticus TaxID=752140 RepID=UPI000304DA3C|nr:hypothetical protein [Pedobacter arcticus]